MRFFLYKTPFSGKVVFYFTNEGVNIMQIKNLNAY